MKKKDLEKLKDQGAASTSKSEPVVGKLLYFV